MGLLKALLPVERMKGIFVQFPLSSLCAVLFFSFLLVVLHFEQIWENKVFLHYFSVVFDFFGKDQNFDSRLLAVFGFGFFWFGALKLVVEARAVSFPVQGVAGLGGLALFAAAVFCLPNVHVMYFVLMILPVLLLALGVGAYAFSGRDDLSFWSFNSKMWLGVLVAILAGLLWWAGGALGLLAIDELFGVDVDSKVYMDVFAVSLLLLTPLYALSWVPEKFDFSGDECTAPPQISFVIHWVLGPLTILYLLILYAYFVKIAIMGEMPHGYLSVMTMGFAGVGVVTYLVSYPLRDGGNVLIGFLHRYFFPLLIVPALMQGWALYERVAQYGVTEQRYLVGLSAAFFLVSAVVFTWGRVSKRRVSIVVLPVVLAAFLFFGSVGPFGAVAVSERSQMGRLEALLVKYEMLDDAGQLVKTEKVVSFEDRKRLSSLLDYFRGRAHVSEIDGWFFKGVDTYNVSDMANNVSDMAKVLGFDYV